MLLVQQQKDKLHALRKAYPGARLLIVSNSAGTSSEDPWGRDVRKIHRVSIVLKTGAVSLRGKKQIGHTSRTEYIHPCPAS